MKKIRTKINKITDSFEEWRFDMETTMWDCVIYFWNKETNITFFFELPNAEEPYEKERGRDFEITSKVKISIDDEWITIVNNDINKLILKTKEIINGKKEK